jgi:hypothetical protein
MRDVRDYVRQVAKAVGDQEPIQELGTRLINEISAEMVVLNERMSGYQQQIMAIRTLMSMYPDTVTGEGHAASRGSAISTPPATRELTTPSGGGWIPITGLTEGQKLKVMAAAVSLVREQGARANVDLLLARLTEQGEELANVAQPRSVAGSFLYRARLRLKKSGENVSNGR